MVWGLGNECLWSTQTLVWKGAVKVQSIIVMAYLLSKAGKYQRLSSPSWLSLISRNCWWVVNALRDWWWQRSEGTHLTCRAMLGTLLDPPRPQFLLSAFQCAHTLFPEKSLTWKQSSDTWLMEALRQGLSLVTGTLGNNWYKLPQTLKAAGPPSHRLFLGPIRQIKWHRN